MANKSFSGKRLRGKSVFFADQPELRDRSTLDRYEVEHNLTSKRSPELPEGHLELKNGAIYDPHEEILNSARPDWWEHANGERNRPSHFPVGPHRKAFLYYDEPEVREYYRFIGIHQEFSELPQLPSALRESLKRSSSNESEFREHLRSLERAAKILTRLGNGSKR